MSELINAVGLRTEYEDGRALLPFCRGSEGSRYRESTVAERAGCGVADGCVLSRAISVVAGDTGACTTKCGGWTGGAAFVGERQDGVPRRGA